MARKVAEKSPHCQWPVFLVSEFWVFLWWWEWEAKGKKRVCLNLIFTWGLCFSTQFTSQFYLRSFCQSCQFACRVDHSEVCNRAPPQKNSSCSAASIVTTHWINFLVDFGGWSLVTTALGRLWLFQNCNPKTTTRPFCFSYIFFSTMNLIPLHLESFVEIFKLVNYLWKN